MSREETIKTVAIIGAGPVGSLNACYLSKRNYRVDVYEKRSDIRNAEGERGRSINLSLAVRGSEALEVVGVKEKVMQNGIRMYSRMAHDRDGTIRVFPYGRKDQFAIPENHLHLWPRDEYMMIALPNQDKSFTVTLFMPFKIFESIETEDDLMDFFNKNFKDSINLIGETELKQMYFQSKAHPLISIKCSPYHIKDKALIMGDAAHAMVPFYGQGMNCGFEDCRVLNDLLEKHKDDIGAAFEEYTSVRAIDAKAICDLAMDNYIEMRHNVNTRQFRIRKKVDNLLAWLFPGIWIPHYSMAITRFLLAFGGICCLSAGLGIWQIYQGNLSIRDRLLQLAKSLRPDWS